MNNLLVLNIICLAIIYCVACLIGEFAFATAVICTIILRIQHMSFGVIVCQPCK